MAEDRYLHRAGGLTVEDRTITGRAALCLRISFLTILLAVFVVAVLASGCTTEGGRLVPGADTPQEADRRNEALLNSLPSHPGSVLVEREIWDEYCCHPAERSRLFILRLRHRCPLARSASLLPRTAYAERLGRRPGGNRWARVPSRW